MLSTISEVCCSAVQPSQHQLQYFSVDHADDQAIDLCPAQPRLPWPRPLSGIKLNFETSNSPQQPAAWPDWCSRYCADLSRVRAQAAKIFVQRFSASARHQQRARSEEWNNIFMVSCWWPGGWVGRRRRGAVGQYFSGWIKTTHHCLFVLLLGCWPSLPSPGCDVQDLASYCPLSLAHRHSPCAS